MEQVRDAVDKGATAVLGGGRPNLPGAFVEPTVLTDVTPGMRAYREVPLRPRRRGLPGRGRGRGIGRHLPLRPGRRGLRR
ncbi:aldehyde dehydrogenase family protein [Streptomyces sp. NPDC048251]|uniref:aldehyde dehydrogenase family protein n=1 Tax=Streptomyces sp. NPDC048251 TaxID=3154501 RepID=UPI0034361A57